jgi:cytochrome c peroxidase
LLLRTLPQLRASIAARAALLATLTLAPLAKAQGPEGLAALGRLLFFDVNLSATRTQACASCHDPARAFSDGADNGVGGAVSLGADGRSLGDRNAPALTYAALAPAFGRLENGGYAGGLFHDGRAADLEAQAPQPLLDPREMALEDRRSLAARLRERPDYLEGFERLLGPNAAESDENLAEAALRAIASYERSAEFFTFDSKYDRFLAGEYTFTPAEAIGRELFFSDLTNCRLCHLRDPNQVVAREPFSNYQYHNIGVPVNTAVRAANGLSTDFVDVGLAANPGVDDAAGARGKFRVPSLRNVAVTAPYMHNGVFADLETAVLFYGRHLASQAVATINPHTGEPWADPEVPETVEGMLLRQGQPLEPQRVAQLVAFLKTLTDRRYEALLD